MNHATQKASASGDRVRVFYDTVGWVEDDRGVATDTALFGAIDEGPISRGAELVRTSRMRAAIASARADGAPLDLLEAGCGGNPATFLADLCGSYTGADFSTTGLDRAERLLRAARPGVRSRFVCADLAALPFETASFDAVYSAHALYHMADPGAQERAFAEILRVLRPGGVAVLVLANPRPLAFPVRLALRLAADTPLLGPGLDRLRPPPPLPYKPMTIRWTRKRLERGADVSVSCHSMASVWFTRKVSERGALGRTLWRTIAWLERDHSGLASRLGNYVTIVARRKSASA